MDPRQQTIRKYEAYISRLENTNRRAADLIHSQERQIQIYEELVATQDELIAELSAELEETKAFADKMAGILNSPDNDDVEEEG